MTLLMSDLRADRHRAMADAAAEPGDYLALAGLPVHPRQIFLARFAAFAIFATAIVVALNALPAALSTAPLANAAAWSMACYFPMFAMIGLQGALLNLLPRKWFPRIAPLLLGVLSCGLLLGVLGSFHIGAWAADGEALLEKFAWAPASVVRRVRTDAARKP